MICPGHWHSQKIQKTKYETRDYDFSIQLRSSNLITHSQAHTFHLCIYFVFFIHLFNIVCVAAKKMFEIILISSRTPISLAFHPILWHALCPLRVCFSN